MAQLIVPTYAMLTYLIVNRFYCRILPKRNCIKHPLASSLVLQAAVLIVWCSVFSSDVTAGLSLLVNCLLFVCCILFFKGSFFHRICAFFIGCFVTTLGEIVSGGMFLVVNLFFPEWNLIPKMMIQDGRTSLTSLMLLLNILFLIFVFSKLGGVLENCFLSLRPSLLLRLGGPLAVLLFLQTGLYAFSDIKKYLLYSLLYGITVLICLLILNSALKELNAQESRNAELEIQRKLVGLRLEHFRKTACEYQSLRKWNHDISNHLLALSYLINQGQTDEAGQYIDSLFDTYGLGEDKK